MRCNTGRFGEAEEEFVRAGKPKEAIDMYCHQQDWAAALSVANTCDPASVPSICALQVIVLYSALAKRVETCVAYQGPLYPGAAQGCCLKTAAAYWAPTQPIVTGPI